MNMDGQEVLAEWRRLAADAGYAHPDLGEVHQITCTMAELMDPEKFGKILERDGLLSCKALVAEYLKGPA
jgi:hypothetical protein